jgi:hypothetical protein
MNLKMIRKFFYIAALSALAFFVSSCQKDIFGSIGHRGTEVNFTIQVGDMRTKDIADASNIDVLYWEVYDEDVETASKPLAEGSVDDPDRDGTFSLDLSLILDQTYHLIFWAQVKPEKGRVHYNVEDLRKVKIIPSKTVTDSDGNVCQVVDANDESRAAFFAHEKLHVSGSVDTTITLYRPFSQINLGSTTYETSFDQNGGKVKVETSEMKVTYMATSFNTLTGQGEGEQTVIFKANQTPNGTEDQNKKLLKANHSEYYWLGMNYLIVYGDTDNVTVDITLDTNFGGVTHRIESVPVKENYRTNLLGNFLTTNATFAVVVDEGFQKSDIIVGDNN